MQVTETNAEGLKREFRVVIPAGELEEKVTSRLGEIGRSIQLRGFRPGKVPMQILRQRFGTSVLGEVLESTLQGTSADAIREHNLRPALPPKVDIVSFSEGTDLEYKMSLEVLPDIPEPSFADLDIERLVVEVPDEDVDRAIERMAEQQRKTEVAERPAESGDIIVVDIEGHSGEREIPGAAGKDRQILLGSSGFIPGFEEQLIGGAAGEHRTVRVTFPEDYGVPDFAGKEAVFEVDVKEVRQRLSVVIDDELGKAVGLESLAELRDEVRQQMQRDYQAASRLRLKRSLLDKLAQNYDFPVPPGMVDLEFENIWRQHEAEEERAAQQEGAAAEPTSAPGEEPGQETAPPGVPDRPTGEQVADAASPEPVQAEGEIRPNAAQVGDQEADKGEEVAAKEDDETLKAEYRRIAERRVRLGLLLAETGRSNNITVTQDELNQAITREARRHPGYERQVLDFYRQNSDAVANLRAPIFEDKVVDFIVELAKVQERKISPQELLTLPDPDDTSGPQASGPDASGAAAD
ncbi:MAG TPA: trigger factor [Stellaceae bacterium]|jgi:trigger factor|nr:trigger factor [Stellaceae bacterium]